MRLFQVRLFWICCVLLCGSLLKGVGDELEQGFAAPPDSTKPWCYWYWISDNITKEGITKDLEAMARVGIGEALIGNIYLPETKPGDVKVLSDSWWSMIEHAIREGGRVGVNVGMFNCPGWSQSGGPWIKPEQSMRYLVSSETRVSGPVRFKDRLVSPAENFQQVAVQAFPAPEHDGRNAIAVADEFTAEPSIENLSKLADGDLNSSVSLPTLRNQAHVLTVSFTNNVTIRSLAIYPGGKEFVAECRLEARDATGWRAVRNFRVDRSNNSIGVGPMPSGPVVVSFAPVSSDSFRLHLTVTRGPAEIAEIILSPAARLEWFVEKQLGKMHPTPSPQWDSYLWETQPEIDQPGLAISLKQIRDLTSRVTKDGVLEWDVPPGDWVIVRTGMTPTGTRNSPASPEGQGLEVDKMNRTAAKAHFNSFIGELLRRMPARDRKAFTRVVADSYEMGSQNWTDDLRPAFAKRFGYDPLPWLPVLTGRIVENADQSERFLWDLRRLVADRIATEYVGGLRQECEAAGVRLWLENYGHWGFPAEFLQYGSQSDRIGGEFWVTGLGEIECRAASSCANTYGKGFVSAEAFTGGPAFQSTPGSLKARGDWAFIQGINHFVLHVYIHQPWEDRRPGVNAWFGTEFNRHNTWFENSRDWITYLRRSCWLLQQGHRVADVAYFIGEDAPKMTGSKNPELPRGFDYDFINADVIENHMQVSDGALVASKGPAYKVLVLPDQTTMRPEVLQKIEKLVESGATVYGRPPSRSPSREKFPECDGQVKELAQQLWGEQPIAAQGTRAVGKGKVVWGTSLADLFESGKIAPDFSSGQSLQVTHRRSGQTDIYFIANSRSDEVSTVAEFRVAGRQPEYWDPETGRITRAGAWLETNGVTRLPLKLASSGSVFLVFREKVEASADPVIQAKRGDSVLLDLTAPVREGKDKAQAKAGTFTLAFWVKPSAETTILSEKNEGISGLSEPRNDVIAAAHGNTFGSDSEHAGAGIAVGLNGISVFEHAGGYFVPILVYPGPITNWTHVTLVYDEKRPSLYLNGVLARQGLPTRYIVHSSLGGGASAGFQGKVRAVTQFDEALSPERVKALAEQMRRGEGVEQEVQLAVSEGVLAATVGSPGPLQLRTSKGKSHELEVLPVPSPFELQGLWTVRFAPAIGDARELAFDHLVDWMNHESVAVKYFSGTATYFKTFSVTNLSPHQGVYLDLGEVFGVASIRVNGKPVGALWTAPWRIDVTKAVRLGTNQLEIDVVNSWNNHLVGDARLVGRPEAASLTVPVVQKKSPLRPAGLIGPVRLEYEVSMPVK